MKKKIFIWCSNLQTNNGEGILANKFIKDLKIINKKYIFITKSISAKNTNFFRGIIGNNADRLLFPFLGIIYLWFIFIFKREKKICYVNYLPLWNFLLFLFLPPQTILGPITGGSKYLKKPLLNYLLRKIVLNFFCILSLKILKFRQNKLLFSTDLLKIKFIKFKNVIFNYVFKDFYFYSKKISRKYDIIFYIGFHKNKNNDLLINIAKKLSIKNFKVITIGQKIKNKKITNMGIIKRKKLLNILQQTKYAFLSTENMYSLFSLDCLSNGVHVFYNKENYPIKELKNNMTPLNYSKKNILIKSIEKKLKQKFEKQKKIVLKNRENFKNYFKV